MVHPFITRPAHFGLLNSYTLKQWCLDLLYLWVQPTVR